MSLAAPRAGRARSVMTLSVLAFDCAGSSCSAAVFAAGAARSARFELMGRGQSERLVPMIGEVMAEAGLAYGQLDAIAVTRGPGGFTGVRIGLATARGLGLATGRPLIGVTNFEAVAAAVPAAPAEDRPLLVILETKRDDLFVQRFAVEAGQWRAAAPGLSLPAAELAGHVGTGPLVLAGDAAARAARALPAGIRAALELRAEACHAEAAVVARLVAGRPLPAEAAPPTPVYLRAPDVSRPK